MPTPLGEAHEPDLWHDRIAIVTDHTAFEYDNIVEYAKLLVDPCNATATECRIVKA